MGCLFFFVVNGLVFGFFEVGIIFLVLRLWSRVWDSLDIGKILVFKFVFVWGFVVLWLEVFFVVCVGFVFRFDLL